MSETDDDAAEYFAGAWRRSRTRAQQLEAALQEIRAHMHACLIQRAPSDDAVIFDHIRAAYDLAAPVSDKEQA